MLCLSLGVALGVPSWWCRPWASLGPGIYSVGWRVGGVDVWFPPVVSSYPIFPRMVLWLGTFQMRQVPTYIWCLTLSTP